MNSFPSIVAVGCLLLGPCCARVCADMGRLVLAERQGDYQVSVFVSPEPLRAGPVDISVLLQNAETGQPIDDAEVNLRLTSGVAGEPAIHAIATQAAATNKLLRAALIELPSPGSWDVEIAYVADRTPGRPIRFNIEAAQPLPQWLTVWPWFSWPAAVALLFGIHRWIVARTNSSRSSRISTAELVSEQRDHALVWP